MSSASSASSLAASSVVAGGIERHGQPLEQRLVGVEAAHRPVAPGDRGHGEDAAGDRGGQPGALGDVEVGDAYELLEPHPLERVDVRLRLALGRQEERDLPGHVPVHRTLLGEHATQVAEELLERVEAAGWTGSAHGGIVGP